MMMRRPGIWTANGCPRDAGEMLGWLPGALTCFHDYLGPNRVAQYHRDYPAAPIIIRFQHPTNWQADPAVSAYHHAEYVLSKWREVQELQPYVYFCNEMNLHYENGDPNPGNQWRYESPEFYQALAAWLGLVADRIKQQAPDMRLVCPPFAFGHHEDGAPDDSGNPKEGWAGYDFLVDLVRQYFGGIVCGHYYWGDASGSIPARLYDPVEASWHAFRWRRVLNLFQARYGLLAQIIIDEAGNLGAADPDFTDQVLYYSRQTLADPRVIALTFFLWQDPTNSPGNIANSWVQRCANLSDHLARLAAEPDVTPTPPPVTIRVLKDGAILTLPLEEYLRSVVPAELGAEALRIPDDPWRPNGATHEERTHYEALKAQAVLARSYALWRIAHPRHASFDVYANTSDQVYNPARINQRSDQAVRETAGVHLIDAAGQPFKAEYISRCGQTACSWCNGAPGHKNEVWPGRACQLGLQTLANAGHTWRTIALAYYPETIRWSDIQ